MGSNKHHDIATIKVGRDINPMEGKIYKLPAPVSLVYILLAIAKKRGQFLRRSGNKTL